MNYVYLMRSGTRYKIGRAKNVGQRLRTFRTADPAIRVEHVIPCHQASQLEAELHKVFHHKHIDLEWFALAPEDIAFIKALGGSAGQWLARRQRNRRQWKHLKRNMRWLVGVGLRLAALALILYLAWRALISVYPQIVRIIR